MSLSFHKRLTPFLLAIGLILLSGAAIAQDDQINCTEVEAMVQQFLPPGVTLANAGDEQIGDAVYRAVMASPGNVLAIVSCCCGARADKATVITAAAIRALPDKEKEIIDAARKALQGKGEKVQRDFNHVYGEWSPITDRQERPASPVKP